MSTVPADMTVEKVNVMPESGCRALMLHSLWLLLDLVLKLFVCGLLLCAGSWSQFIEKFQIQVDMTERASEDCFRETVHVRQECFVVRVALLSSRPSDALSHKV